MKRRKFLVASSLAVTSLAGLESNARTLENKDDKGFVVKAKKSRFNEQTKLSGISPNDIKISSKDTKGQLTVFEYTGNEKGGPPLHVHLYQDEIFYVLSGDYLFQLDNEQHQLAEGDIIFLPRNVPHTFAQLTDKGKMLYFFSPSGKMEDYFRVLGTLTAPPSPEEGAKIFENHDMKVVGPPLSLK